jgi:hemoglobin
MKVHQWIAGFLAALALCSAHANDDSLYRAWGGKEGIRGVMDDFVPRLKADPRIGHFFKDTSSKHLITQLTDQLCQLSGGPCVYDGPDMAMAHADMGVERRHFNALVEVLQTSMTHKGLAFAHQNRMLALLAPMHRDIVTVR